VFARQVVIVAYPRMQSLDAVGPFEVFAAAGRLSAAGGTTAGRPSEAGYRIVLASLPGGPVTAASGVVTRLRPLSATTGPPGSEASTMR